MRLTETHFSLTDCLEGGVSSLALNLRFAATHHSGPVPARNAVPACKDNNGKEVDRISSFIKCPPSCGFMAEPVGTRQGSSLTLDERAESARP